MGKKKLPPKEKLNVVAFRLSDEDLAVIDAAAKAAGMTRTQWGRAVMLNAAQHPSPQEGGRLIGQPEK